MKRLRTFLSLLLILIYAGAFSVFAAAVPKPVLKANDSVIRILTSYSNGDMASGSGFVIADDKTNTYIVTNWHVAVMDNPSYISVILNSEAEINASVAAFDESRDLAVLKVAMPLGMDPLKLNHSAAGKGDAIYVIGFPGGADSLSDNLALSHEETTITDGIVSAIRQATLSEGGSPRDLVQVSAAINSGNSGGPVLDERGNVIGVSTYSISDATDINGAVSVTELVSFLQENGLSYTLGNSGLAVNPALIAGVIGALVVIVLGAFLIIRRKDAAKPTPAVQKAHEPLGTFSKTPDGTYVYTPTAPSPAKEKKTQISIAKIVPVVLAVVALVIGGTGFYGYSTVQKSIASGNTENLNPFFLQIAGIADKNLRPYINAMKLLNSGDFQEAEQEFSALSGYRNCDDMVLECRYRRGKQLIADQEFEEAKEIFSGLGSYSDSADMIKEAEYQRGLVEMEKGNYNGAINIYKQLALDPCYKDSDIMIKEVQYQNAVNLYSNERYASAYKQIKELADEGYQKAVDDLPTVTETTYQAAIGYYRSDDVANAESTFRLLDNYKDSDRYEEISRIKNEASTAEFLYEHNMKSSELPDNIDFLLNNLDFEDAAEIILCNGAYADCFLRGTWRSADRYYYFTMENNGDTSYNLPDVRNGGTYNIYKGTYTSTVNGNDYKEYIFEVIDRNTIDVFCFSDRYTYTLYRD